MIEADWERFYHRDLATDVETKGCRWLQVRVWGLPQDSAFWLTMSASRQQEQPESTVRRLSVREFAEQVQKGRLN